MDAAGPIDLARGAHISGSTTAVIVRWVRGHCGDEGVLRLLDSAGECRPVEVLEDGEVWSSYRQATALLEAAVAVTGRADAARRIGEEMLAQHRSTPVVELLRSLGSPEALLASIAESGAKFSTVFSLTPQQVQPGQAVVVGSTPPGVPRHRLLCEFTSGILSIIPTVFDLDAAVVTESQCQARGGAHCAYTLTWSPDVPSDSSEAQRQAVLLEKRLQEVQERLTSLQSTAAELVSATDVHQALELLTARAGRAVRATSFLLAVQLPAEAGLRVHAAGLTAAEAAELVPTVLAEGSTSSRLVAEVRSSTRSYGVLAAMLPPDVSFFPQEIDLLTSYAGYAANLLDTASALEEARREGATARALLELSRSLAEVAAPAEVAQRLAAAVLRVVDCDQSSVLLWDETDLRLRLAAAQNVAPEAEQLLREHGVGLDDTPALRSMLTVREPLFLSGDHPDPYLREILSRSHSAAAVVVPIVGAGRFYGIVTAGARSDVGRLSASPGLLERLAGIASHGATALTNAHLLTELREQAVRDPLTGLPNRALLVQRMDAVLADRRAGAADCAVLFLDLDRFKQVNDSLGHLTGDLLLVEVARRLADVVRDGDTVARLGGDEFAVLLPQVASPDVALEVAGRVLAELARPFHLEGQDFFVGGSVGISLGRYGAGDSSTELLRAADGAMYSAKAAGGGTAHLAPASGGPVVQSGLQLRTELHRAIGRRQLRVLYQPLVALDTGNVVGVEALVRWRHPVLGMLSPAQFLPLAEDTELAVDIDLWVLAQACRQLRQWRPELRLAVNVSRRTLTSERLLGAVREQLVDGVLTGRLELEVTELLLDVAPEQLSQLLQPLRALGARIAIDDFGTGSSGFARLQGEHVQTLKIDRSFLAEITSPDDPAPVLDAVLAMGAALRLDLIAEGIERPVEREWLLRAGCTTGQGYLLGRPADAATTARLLRRPLPAPRAPSRQDRVRGA